MILPSPCGPRRITYIHARFFITTLRPTVYFRVLSKHEDLSPMHEEGLFGICVQGVLNVVRGRKNDISASSILLHEDALDLNKSLQDGTDVGLNSI